ncbi:matrixin family metalloprotease [Halorussus halophilus]|uniref:matrixin family metalloprotease n=1 Tax=Halorussus halophilus TaxID=2650975 RepID=UPI001CE48706|nr:matrixin family metalloprotease [Halorussus halophilus]
MWRPVLVVVLVVLAGCGAYAPGVSDTTTSAGSQADQQAMSESQESGPRANPWGETTLTVGINNTANESRDFRPLVRDALAYWSNNSEQYAGYAINYEFAPNATNPDLVIHFVEGIGECANVSEPAGCAPYVTKAGQVSRPISVRIVDSYSDNSTRLILKHELGHTLGLNHSAKPQTVMSHTSQLTTLPQRNATERRLPWADSNFTVYLDAANVSDSEQAREQVRHALDYYSDGANGTVPTNVSYEFTDNRTTADVIIEFSERLPCRDAGSGSCGRVRGIDPDGDGALERYDKLYVTMSDIDTDAAGWHVGYWLGYGFGFEEEGEWPAPFEDASYSDRRSEWWTDS